MDLDNFEHMHSKLSLAGLSKPALVGIAALVIMVAVLAGRNIIGTATATEFEVVSASAGQARAQEEQPVGEVGTIFVHVSGCVENPGLYEIEQGSRLAVAIEAAGGFSDDAACDSVNLARLLEDGEMVVVAPEGGMGGEETGSQSTQQTGGRQAGGLVNINTASAEELEQLPGIGPSTAQKIVSDRTVNGSFGQTSDLKRVSGIGDKKFDAIASLICV